MYNELLPKDTFLFFLTLCQNLGKLCSVYFEFNDTKVT